MKNTYLDSAAKIQIVLTGAVTTNQLQWTCSYYNRVLATGVVTEGEYSGVTNGSTAVDVLPAPASGSVRVMKNVTVYNADTATAIVILQLVDAGGTRVLVRNSLTTLASWSVDDMSYYTDISGKVDGPASATDSRVAAFNGTTGKIIKDSGILYTDLDTLSGTQTLTGAKTFDAAITNKQVATPANPSSGYNKLYFKSDDKLYKLTSGGTETEIGAGGGGGLLNRIANVDGTVYTGLIGWYVFSAAATLTSVRATSLTAPTGSGIRVALRKNSTTTNNVITAGYVEIAATATSGTDSTLDSSNKVFAAGDILYVVVTQIGSTVSGSDLSITIA